MANDKFPTISKDVLREDARRGLATDWPDEIQASIERLARRYANVPAESVSEETLSVLIGVLGDVKRAAFGVSEEYEQVLTATALAAVLAWTDNDNTYPAEKTWDDEVLSA